MPEAAPRPAYVYRMALHPLERIAAASTLTRDLLQQAWEELAPQIKALCPQRHRAIQQAFALEDLPLEVLARYFMRETQRALETLSAERVAR